MGKNSPHAQRTVQQNGNISISYIIVSLNSVWMLLEKLTAVFEN